MAGRRHDRPAAGRAGVPPARHGAGIGRRTAIPAGLPAPLAGAGLGAAAIAALIGGGLLVDRRPPALDRAIVLGMRAWGGPRWLPGAAVDVTALGSVTVLTLLVLAAAVLLLVRRRWRTALAAVLACASVSGAIELVKRDVARPRPALVPHLVAASHASFPSGHAAGSAAIYLTLAMLAGQATADPRVRRALIAMAALLVATIGTSRVYLGVHWPSDVLAGWAFGTVWALAWWVATAGMRERPGGGTGATRPPIPPSIR